MEVNLNKYVNDFISKVAYINHGQNAMFNNELYVVYALYKELGCNLFIESGIDYGISTIKYLNLIYDEYFGIDINEHCAGKYINADNFKFICGESNNIIKLLVDERKGKNIFIMIDGPKGHDAIQLKNKLLENDDVKIVAIHDTYDGLENENHLRIFETKTNKEYYEKYFELLNKGISDDITTIYNLKNNLLPKTYAECYPTGPGVSIYSKIKIDFII